ncbi:repetitive organellar protein-like [Oppia nitens]|uniref:repetitive organellar protein-like n=1 Tax=Oppia nitens TaxID=1686743 RepID=UPI0023DBCD82|nr:repetitive organellar protein-like [Oppia nitens]
MPDLEDDEKKTNKRRKNIVEKERIAEKRLKNPELRDREREANKIKMAEKRLKNPELRDREREADKIKKAEKRLKNQELRDREREANKIKMAEKRLKNPELRDREREADKIKKAEKRLKNQELRDREKEANKIKMAEKRLKNQELRNREREADKIKKAEKRLKNQELRDREREANKIKMAEKRLKNEELRNREREANKIKMAEKRLKNQELRDRERETNKIKMAEKRLKNPELRDRERETNKIKMAEKRLKNPELRDREREDNKIKMAEKRKNKKILKNLEKFEEAKFMGPTEMCSCCGCLWFKTQVRSYNILNNIKLNKNDKDLVDFFNVGENCQFCNTCFQDISKGKVPRLALSHGLMFPEIPDCIQKLNDLEERMVSARIIFETILHLPKGGQYKMKGNVVNVPVDPNAMLPLLPRLDDDLHIIRVQLKRRIKDPDKLKIDDLYKTVRPHELRQALNFLVNQNAYKNAGVKLKKDWFIRFPNDFSKTSDAEDDQQNSFENEESDIVGCLDTLLDNDDQQIGVAYAPGEGKKPLNVLIDVNAASLAYPKLFAGNERPLVTKTMRFTVTDFAKSELRRYDRRCAENIPYLFFTFKRKQWYEATSASNIFKRKIKGQSEWSANDALDNIKVNQAIASDKAFKSISKLRTSPSYWEKNVMKQLQ